MHDLTCVMNSNGVPLKTELQCGPPPRKFALSIACIVNCSYYFQCIVFTNKLIISGSDNFCLFEHGSYGDIQSFTSLRNG